MNLYQKLGTFLLAFGLLASTQVTVLNAENNLPKCNSSVEARGPENDSPWDWDEGKIDIPCYGTIYQLTGTVSTDVNSLTIQTSPGGGSGGGSIVGAGGFTYGSFGWSSTGPEFSGKGFVRLKVTASNDDLISMAPVGSTIIIKMTDTKAVALLPGDTITVKCRKEYEAVGAIAASEKFTEETLDAAATYELDYCRLASPIVN